MSNDKSIIIFGQDITKIPCFRNSFLYGISSGLGAGLFYFMLTSRVQMGCHVGMASFTLVTLGYWVHCRYNYSKTRFEMLKLQRLIQQQALYEGTALEKEVDEEVRKKKENA